MIALVAVLAVALADAATPSVGLSWLTPSFLAALTTLITAAAALVAVLRGQQTQQDTHDTVKQVAQQTNGVVATMQERLTFLEQELAGTQHRAAARSATGPSGPTSAPQIQ